MKIENNEIKILVVDDVPGNIFFLEGLLLGEDFKVVTAESGEQALSVLNEQNIDLVLLDIMMPEMSGIEVLERIQSNEALKNIPVIMVSAKAEAENVDEALQKGAIEYIRKPINEVELLARLNTTLRIKVQENKLKQMLKSKEDFIRMVSHDLRTPFAAISGFAGMLLVDEDLSQKMKSSHKEFLSLIVDTSHFIVDYFNKLLTWSNMETKELMLKTQETDLLKIVTTSKVIFDSKLTEKNIELKIDVPSDIRIYADSTYFNQVINNLVGNAIKFTPKGGAIIVQATPENNSIFLKVIDNGVGMKKMTNEDLFEKAFHTSTNGTEGEKGTGVGLHICKKIIDAHGFDIHFNSEPDQGTEFIISIPQQKIIKS